MSVYILPEDYLTWEVSEKSIYKTVKDGYERNLFSVIKRGGKFYVEGYNCPDGLYKRVIRETKRIFPHLEYLLE